MMSYASYFVVLLSRGMLRDPSFARLLLAATSSPNFSSSGVNSRTAHPALWIPFLHVSSCTVHHIRHLDRCEKSEARVGEGERDQERKRERVLKERKKEPFWLKSPASSSPPLGKGGWAPACLPPGGLALEGAGGRASQQGGGGGAA